MSGKVSAKLTKGASVSKHERTKISVSRYARMSFIEQFKYLPVILERNEKAVGNIVMKKYGKE